MLGLLVVLQTQASHPYDLRAEERHVRDTVNMLYTAFSSGAQPPAILVEKKQHHVVWLPHYRSKSCTHSTLLQLTATSHICKTLLAHKIHNFLTCILTAN